VSRALVLGGGGLTAIAWEAGVLQGLAAGSGLEPDWDLVVGTSAGAYVGARLRVDGSPEPLFREQESSDPGVVDRDLAEVAGRLAVRLVRLSRRRGLGWIQTAGVIPLTVRAVLASAARNGPAEVGALPALIRSRRPGTAPGDAVRAMGRIAAAIATPEEWWVSYWEHALEPIIEWPDRRLIITAYDIGDGSRRAFDASDGVPLARAIAASTALPGLLPPITTGRRRWMDGGVGSQTNADLALGHGEVLILAPVDRGALAGELQLLASGGAVASVIVPCTPSVCAMGRELGRLDPDRIRGSARAGREDGLAAASRPEVRRLLGFGPH